MAENNSLNNKSSTLTVDNALTVTAGGASITGTSTIDGSNAAVTIKSGTGQLDISADAAAGTVNIATGAGAKVVTLGSTNGASSLALKYGTADFSLASATGTVMAALDTGEVTKPLQPAFSAYVSSGSIANITGDGTAYNPPFDTEFFDRNGDFNTGTYVFTAPVTGIFQFSGSVSVGAVEAGHTLGLGRLITTDQTFFSLYSNWANGRASNNIYICQAAWLVEMDAGDTAYMQIAAYNSTKTVDLYGAAGNATFSGALIC